MSESPSRLSTPSASDYSEGSTQGRITTRIPIARPRRTSIARLSTTLSSSLSPPSFRRRHLSAPALEPMEEASPPQRRRSSLVPGSAVDDPDVLPRGAERSIPMRARYLDAEARYRSGAAAHRLGERKTARRLLQEALRLNPNHIAAQFELGQLLESQKKLKAAMRHYRAVLDVNARHAPALHRVGTLLSRKPEEVTSALHAWQTLLEVEPHCQTAHREVASLLHQRGDSALLAEDHYLQALAADPADVECRLRLAVFYRDVFQDLDAAYFHLAAARCILPYSEEVEELMADVTRAMDKRGGVPLAQHDASEASGAPPVLV